LSRSETGEPAETRVTLKNVGKIRPDSIDDYLRTGGYSALKKALETPREELIDDLVAASLRGRGGAGFSAGLKERFTRRSAGKDGQTYLVCNADEGEPGTFKDRIIMIGAAHAYIYIRAEYHQSIRSLSAAISESRSRGFVGPNAGTSTAIDIDIRLGAGSYLCGEELTLIESLEGKRGYPRIKPPFPAERGLWGSPTLVNNVETLATIPAIIANGPQWYLGLGTEDTPGTKIFTVSGDVNRPGYYEVELGMTVRELIDGIAGGVRGGGAIKAVLLGGAAGTFVDESVLDTPLGFDSLKEVGAVIGSGAVVVLAEGRSIRDITLSILEFFEHESCGKCVPCRVGMSILVDRMRSLMTGHPGGPEPGLDVLDEMVDEAEYMSRTSLCPLGQSPVLPLKSLRRYFASDFQEDPSDYHRRSTG
jgi:NADH:ubiquinone oxidoreductase subunit F (NADH-binding)